MAFYEGAGPDFHKVDTSSDYLKSINGLCGMMRSEQRDMIMAFAEGTRLPYDFMKELIKIRATSVSDGGWQKTRYHSYSGGGYEAALPHAILIEDVSQLIPFFNAVQKYGSLKISDIKALEYSIFAFNDKPDHWASLAKSVSRFNDYSTDLYNMMFVFTDTYGKKTSFSLNINVSRCKVGKLSSSLEKRASLLEYWFPKFDQYFHKNEDKINETVIKDFVQDCRTAVKERQDGTLLSK